MLPVSPVCMLFEPEGCLVNLSLCLSLCDCLPCLWVSVFCVSVCPVFGPLSSVCETVSVCLLCGRGVALSLLSCIESITQGRNGTLSHSFLQESFLRESSTEFYKGWHYRLQLTQLTQTTNIVDQPMFINGYFQPLWKFGKVLSTSVLAAFSKWHTVILQSEARRVHNLRW